MDKTKIQATCLSTCVPATMTAIKLSKEIKEKKQKEEKEGE